MCNIRSHFGFDPSGWRVSRRAGRALRGGAAQRDAMVAHRGARVGREKQDALTPYARKLPKFKRTGNPLVDSQLLIEHQALMKVITLLQTAKLAAGTHDATRSLTMFVLGALEAHIDASATPFDESAFDASVNIMGKVPMDWWASWLTTSFPIISSTLLQKVISVDDEALQKILMFLLQCARTVQLPWECLNRVVMSRTMRARATQLGDRIDLKWTQRSIGEDGVINWLAGGCYDFEWGPNHNATHIKHVSGIKTELAAHIVITKQFTLHENHNDLAAYVQFNDGKQTARHRCSELFANDVGPNKYAWRKSKVEELKKIAISIAVAVEGEKEKVAEGHVKVDRTVLMAPQRAKKVIAATKARAARTVATESKKAARRINLD